MKIESDMGLRPRVIGIASLYLLLGTVGFFLAFCNLDGRLFWQDEAETAVLARNIVKFGVPRVDDGVNHISLHGDKYDARDGIWTWSPWLPEYVTAASFAVFGQTTWAGRAPFALIGWFAVATLGAMAWRIYRSHRVAIGSMLLLGTSEVFLLHIRQCRYYSITVFAEILLLYGIYQILVTKRNGPAFVVLGLTLQFYCNYTIAAANVPLLLILAWNLFRQKRSYALPVLISLAIWLLLCVPWLCYTEFWRQASAEGHDPWTKTLRFYLVQFHFHFFPWCILLLPAGGWLGACLKNRPAAELRARRAGWRGATREHIREKSLTGEQRSQPAGPGARPSGVLLRHVLRKRFSKKKDDSVKENLSPTLRRFETYLFLLPFLYLPALLLMPGGYLRYLLPVLPAACLLVAAWLFRYLRWTALALALLILQCVSNVFAVATDPFSKQLTLRSPLADFVFGALLPYQDRFTDALSFFNKHAQPGDVLVSWDTEFPLMFYTRLKIVNARLSPFPVRPLPDWILPVSLANVFFLPPVPLPDNLKPYYETITLTVHDSPRVDNIPEPDFYQSQSARTMSPFVIYKLKNPNASSTLQR